MIRKKRIIIIIVFCMVLIIGFGIARINTKSPVGAIRYECLLHGYVISALFLQAKEINIEIDGETTVYKITSFVPYEKATATHLDQWNVIKQNGTYSASYGVG
ncbi:MAG: hypothetical protein ACERKN_19135 [Velocimicrobium sp.]